MHKTINCAIEYEGDCQHLLRAKLKFVQLPEYLTHFLCLATYP